MDLFDSVNHLIQVFKITILLVCNESALLLFFNLFLRSHFDLPSDL